MKFKELNSSSQIGVEITEIDLSNPLTEEELDAVRNLWVKNSVAIFPNQKLSHDAYNNFAMQFGKFGEVPARRRALKFGKFLRKLQFRV